MYKRGQYEDALKLYLDAGAVYPSYKIALNIGETLESMGRNTEAATTYHRFLRKFKNAPISARRDAWLRLDGMRRWLSRVKVLCDEDGAQVSLNGKVVGTTPLESSIYFQPGAHTITVEKQGFQPAIREVRMRRGAAMHLRVKFGSSAPPEKAPTPTAPPAKAAAAATDQEAAAATDEKATAKEACPKPTCPPGANDEALRKAHRNMTIAGFVALGASLALVGSAAVLYGVGSARGARAHDDYTASTNPVSMSRHYDDVQDARTMLYVGHGFMAAGLVAAGLSIFQFVARPALPADSEVAVAPLAGGAAFSLGGRF